MSERTYGSKTLTELRAMALAGIGPSDDNIVLINRLAFGKAMISALPDLMKEIEELAGHLDAIIDYCESGNWEHGMDGDEYSSWTTCEGREAIVAMAREAMKVQP